MRFKIKNKFWVICIVSIFALAVTAIAIRVTWIKALESGYVAFNAKDYDTAYKELDLIANFGDPKAQQLIGYMYGLGLGKSVDFGLALHWMRKSGASTDDRKNVGEQAYYLANAALDGLYGEDKKDLGFIWLKIAYFSGESKANDALKKYKPD